MKLNCFKCGTECIECSCAPCSKVLNPSGVFCYCPTCKTHPQDFKQNVIVY